MNTQVHTNVDSLFPTRWSSAAGRGVEICFYQKTKEKLIRYKSLIENLVISLKTKVNLGFSSCKPIVVIRGLLERIRRNTLQLHIPAAIMKCNIFSSDAFFRDQQSQLVGCVHNWSYGTSSHYVRKFWFSLSPCQLQQLFFLLFLRFCPFPGQLTFEATTLRMENFRNT